MDYVAFRRQLGREREREAIAIRGRKMALVGTSANGDFCGTKRLNLKEVGPGGIHCCLGPGILLGGVSCRGCSAAYNH